MYNYIGTARFDGTVQNVTYTGTAAQSAAFGLGITRARIVASTDCYVLQGKSPTASTTTATFIPATFPEYISVVPGEKVSAIQSSSGGVLNITEIG